MAKSSTLQCVIVTPEKAVLDEPADFVALPLYDGEIGVMPGRAPLIGRLGFGELRTKKGNDIHRLYVDGGFVEIKDNVVTILTQKAVPQGSLSAEESKAKLEEIREKSVPAEELDNRLTEQAKMRTQVRMAQKK